MMENNRVARDRKKWLCQNELRESTFGTSRDNGRKRVPRLGPPTMRIALASITKECLLIDWRRGEISYTARVTIQRKHFVIEMPNVL